jgi:putative transposase
VYRYIELNPVRAALVEAAEHYQWSSVHANLALRVDRFVTPHPTFLAMSADVWQRAEAYRTWLYEDVTDDEVASIRLRIKQERAMGSQRFHGGEVARPSGGRQASRSAVALSNNGALISVLHLT